MIAGSHQRAVSSERAGEFRMIRRVFISYCLLFAVFLLAAASAEAQQQAKVSRVGMLSRRGIPTPSNPYPSADAFRQGLRDLGYIEGKNIQIEYRYAEGVEDRLPGLAAELVQLKVDVLVSATLPGIRAAKQATRTIPIVMVTPADQSRVSD